MNALTAGEMRNQGILVREAFLPLVAEEASAHEVERLTSSLASELNVSDRTVDAHRAWITIHAKRAIEDWNRVSADQHLAIDPQELIELTVELEGLSLHEISRSEFLHELAATLDAEASDLFNLVKDYRARVLEEEAKDSSKPVTTSKRDSVVHLPALSELSLAETVLTQLNELFHSSEGSRLLREAKKHSASLATNREFKQLCLLSKLYWEDFQREAASLSGAEIPSTLSSAEYQSLSVQELQRITGESPRVIQKDLDSLATKGFAVSSYRLARGTVYSLNPLLELHSAIDASLPIATSRLSQLITEIRQFAESALK